MEVKRIFDLLNRYEEKFDKQILLGGMVNGVWQRYSSKQYIEHAKNISYGLLKLGIKKGDKIITITTNRPEWNFLDMGILMVGAIHVPIYPNISSEEYKYIFNHSEARIVFVAGKEMYSRIKDILPDCKNIEKLYTFMNLTGVEHLSELIEMGSKNNREKELEEIKNSIQEEDVATIIYTSGTTGTPKGAMLTHKNILSNVSSIYTIPEQDSSLVTLSFLPLCHVYERMLNYMYQYNGYTIYYVDNVAHIVDAMREVKPHIICTVPRLLESIHDKIMATGRKLTGYEKLFFYWAIRIGYKYKKEGKSIFYRLQLWLLRILVFKKWKQSLGGNLDIIVCGGAALQERLSRIFWAAGFRVLEGYGLTETSPVIAVSNFGKNAVEFGTVGPPLKGVEVRIAEDGEIQCKGPNVMKGYFKSETPVSEYLTDDGWFKTGDIGHITKKGNLKITDRKKEIFKTAAGKYIAPQIIENKIKESPFVDNVMVVGENQKYPAAIIAPNFFHLRSWCDVKKITYTSNMDMIKNTVIRKRIGREVEKVNAGLADHERIIKFELTVNAWSVETGELTPTLKLRRKKILTKYKKLHDQLF
ncbi:MAG: long-chain fatty acid--CoA ligase [Bacteroidales bacterium]|nr:long-chain fatty acid--CoA ligase [Bacteroidales bacterium]